MSPLALFNLEGRKALVTGASRGIGQALAAALAGAGADVAVTARDAASLDETRYNLNGVYFELLEEGTKLRMVATDGHRLAMVDRPETPARDQRADRRVEVAAAALGDDESRMRHFRDLVGNGHVSGAGVIETGNHAVGPPR